MTLPEPKNLMGYPASQVEEILDDPETFRIFQAWMQGQASTFDGEMIVYRHELERFLYYKAHGIVSTIGDAC